MVIRLKVKLRPPRLPKFGPEIRTLADHVRTSEIMRRELEHFFSNMTLLVTEDPSEVVLTYRQDGRLHEASGPDWKVTMEYGPDGRATRAVELYEDSWRVSWSLQYDSKGRLVRATPTVSG